MISKITDSISKFLGTDQGQVLHHKYDQMMKTEGFDVHKLFLTEIANGLLGYMVTKKFTDLDQRQKDVEQRAIFECKEMIEFLLDPIKGLRRQRKFDAHNKKMERTVTGTSSKFGT